MKEKNYPFTPDYGKMCYLSDSNEKHRMEMLKIMVKDSKYVCSACGRVASSKEAVCSPEDIKFERGFDLPAPEKVYLGDRGIPDYEKMCFLSDSNEERRMEMLMSMAKDPQYVCSACGRAASSEEAVCSPEKL